MPQPVRSERPRTEIRGPSGPGRFRFLLLVLTLAPLVPAGDALGERAESHTRLERSVPADGDVLAVVPDEALLEFSTGVEPTLSRLVLRFPTGDSILLKVTGVPGAPNRIGASLPVLEPGRHSIAWSTVSADGHRASGTIEFSVVGVEEAAPSAAEAPTSTGPADPEPVVSDPVTSEPASGPSLRRTLFRGLGLAFLLAAAGVLWFAGGSGLVREPSVLRAASATALLATVLLGLDYLDWLLDVRPTDMGLFAGFAAAVRTRIGIVEGGRVLLAGLTFFLAGGARAGRIAGFFAMLAVVVGAAAGHPATIEPAMALPANALHLGAAAIWLGGVLLLAVLPDHPETPQGGWQYHEVASRVSSRAFLAVGVIIGTAFLQDLLFLGDPSFLLSTDYGRLVLAKGAGFALLVAFGAWHRWKTLPRLVATGDASHLRLAVRIEILVMAAVVLVAAWLAMTVPPVAG
ncbi:MAG: copper resistance protein CopC/CopD [marine benthic group bacterium]|nr:copper resistance protein CopC/CopD [Gemmatimonadota bacterium]